MGNGSMLAPWLPIVEQKLPYNLDSVQYCLVPAKVNMKNQIHDQIPINVKYSVCIAIQVRNSAAVKGFWERNQKPALENRLLSAT